MRSNGTIEREQRQCRGEKRKDRDDENASVDVGVKRDPRNERVISDRRVSIPIGNVLLDPNGEKDSPLR